jgi:Lipopolysaccharide kinase (Kdo/WaaP) family
VRASYLISEALEHAQILSHFALGREGEARHGYARRKAVSDALAAELRRLHDAGIYTRDLQETNLMVEARDGALRVYFLDLEDLRRASSVSPRRRMLNLVHLDRSIGRFVSRAGRLDFLYAYLGRQLDRAARRKAVADYLEIRRIVQRSHDRRRA